MNLTWRNPPAHHWYAAKSPGLSKQCRSFRAHQTALARFRSGHLRSMTLVQALKSFFTCPCSLLSSPAHLLDCWGISLRQLYEEQGLVLPLKTRRVGQQYTLNLSRAETSSRWCDVVVRRGGASSGVVHVTCPRFRIAWSVAKSPCVAEQCDVNIHSLKT
ncbi:uncharacterized protein TNCV_2850601 [Trichonephila clavipes]|nr:uncharacterized protein TNCV_2850601 [Trichonephila clavipes]